MEKEQTLVLLKPDAVQRGIIGKIITRFEDTGLKIIAMKMIWADEALAKEHYKLDEAWAKKLFERTKTAYEKEGKNFAHRDHLKYGKMIQEWNVNFLREGPIVAIGLEGPHAVEIVRKMLGHTEPRQAIPGTIRGDFASIESFAVADVKSRVIRNLVHASDSPENGKSEIALWFSEHKLDSPNKKSKN